MTFLITGATGTIGSRVIEALLANGHRPRAFVRDLAKAQARFGDRVDFAVGDLGKAETLREALAGIDRLFLLNEGPDLTARDEAAAGAAKVAGVKWIVKLSTLDVRLATGAGVGTGAWHAEGEASIERSGVSHTFIRPGGFMSNALLWAPGLKAQATVRSSAGEGRIAMVHPDDIAAVATRALLSNDHAGAALELTGPTPLTYGEMTAKISVALGRPLSFQPLTDAQALERQLGFGIPPPVAEAHVSLWRAVREGRMAIVTDTIERVLGRKPKSFDAWVAENVDAFR